MSLHRTQITCILSAGLLAVLAIPAMAQEELPERVFRTQTNVVLAPVTVFDQNDGFVNGLEAREFRLYDNEKLQDISMDVSFTPISLVVAIQRNNRTGTVLKSIKRMGNMLEQLVIGEHGEAALLAFDHRMKVIQDFTNDGQKFTEALETLTPGSSTSAVIDSVFEGIRMLRQRPVDRRRILLLISTTRDKGSEGRMRDALIEAETHNVIIYTININRALASLTAEAPAPRQSSFPVASRPPMPGGGPETPFNAAQLQGSSSMTFVPVIKEIFTQVKAVFVPNHAEVFTKYTGGREYSFVNLRSLERAVSDLGEELHSQYILSYTPNNMDEGGYHEIRVEVNRPSLSVRTRPGYWMAAK